MSIYYPTRSHLYFDQGDYTVPSRIAIPQDPKGYAQLYGYYFRYYFGQSGSFTTSAFDGVVFTDPPAHDIKKVSIGGLTTAGNLTAADLTYTSNSISLNLSGVTYKAGTLIDLDIAAMSPTAVAAVAGPSTVPLPASAPMFGAALMALSAAGYGLRSRKGAAA